MQKLRLRAGEAAAVNAWAEPALAAARERGDHYVYKELRIIAK